MVAYPLYRNSGTHWLETIPEHWEMHKIKYSFNERVEKGFPQEPLLAATQTKGVTLKELYEKRTVVAQKDLELLKLVEIGDFVISLRSFQGGIEYAHHRGIISPAYTVMQLISRVLPEYFQYLAKSTVFISLLRTCVTGIREGQNINYEYLKNNYIPLPSLPEQQQIALYLDWKTAKINKFIKAKKKLIELLKEQKKNIINEAVTKGINPDVKFKNSGVEWIGETPEYWEIRKFSTLARIIRGASPRPSGDPRFFNGTFMPWVTVGEITKDNSPYLETTETNLTEAGTKQSQLIKLGTLIYSNSGATLGVPKITKIDCCANDGVLAFTKLSRNLIPIFGYYYLTSLTERIRKELRQGGTQPNLNTSIVKRIFCPLPPVTEQYLIVKHIEREVSLIDKTIERAKSEIELIQEYRACLISDVVTGKIDVRLVQIPDFESIETEIDLPEDEYSEEELFTENIE